MEISLCARRVRSSSIRLALVAAVALLPFAADAQGMLVFAAASLKPALDRIITMPEVTALGNVRATYAASSQLARQIEAGAPATIYISADEAWMDDVASHKLIAAGTRRDLLGNALVLIAPKQSTLRLAIAPGFNLAGALGTNGHLALAEPNSVPAGRYARQALTTLGVWNSIESRIVAADNVRAALNFVARDEVPLGIVYRSDAASEPAVRVVATFPAHSHAPIVYPAALIAGRSSRSSAPRAVASPR
ncbi:MAG: molybdate ABC transporter substrate-binding protein, partial [Steroidobacteraceae bacterium]